MAPATARQVLAVSHLLLTAVYYIKGVSALKRLAVSDYHTHPDNLRRRERNRNNPYSSSTQMMPL